MNKKTTEVAVLFRRRVCPQIRRSWAGIPLKEALLFLFWKDYGFAYLHVTYQYGSRKDASIKYKKVINLSLYVIALKSYASIEKKW